MSPTVSALQPTPTFGNAVNLLRYLSVGQKVASRYILMDESTTGRASSAFIKDTVTVFGPKAVAARSVADLSEIAFLEFLESGLFYFAPALAGQFLFANLLKPNGLPKVADPALKGKSINWMQQSLPQLEKALADNVLSHTQYRRVLASKAAVLLAAFVGVGMAGEYALSFGKNLMTQGLFKKSSFTSVANLSDQNETPAQERHVREKAHRRLRQVGALSAAILGAGLGIIAAGPRLQGGGLRLLERFVRKFDFAYNPAEKTFKYGLSGAQLTGIIIAGCVSYLDAAREKLEFWESATRLLIVAPYLATKGTIFKTLAIKWFGKKFPETLTKNEQGKTVLKSFDAVVKEARQQVIQQLKKANTPLTEENIARAIARTPIFKGKLVLSMGPILTAMATVGTGVSLIGRFFTQYRFARNQEQLSLANLTYAATHHTTPHPATNDKAQQQHKQPTLSAFVPKTATHKTTLHALPQVAAPALDASWSTFLSTTSKTASRFQQVQFPPVRAHELPSYGQAQRV